MNNTPSNTNTAYGFSAMKTECPQETSPRVIVWMAVAFGFLLCFGLGAVAVILF